MAELVKNRRLVKSNIEMSMPMQAESFHVQEDLTVDGATILTGPLTVTDTNIVVGLNADRLDGHNAGNASGDIPISNGIVCVDLNVGQIDGYEPGNASGYLPISNGILNTDLNADMVDGYNAGNASGDIPISNGTLCTDLNADQVDSCDVETYLTNSSSKIPRSDAVYAAIYRLGSTIRLEKTYTAISATNPWFCLSLPDMNWTTAHFSADFIAEMRARKVIYDEMGASPVSSFGGAWSGDTFTLTDNAENVAMITALAREYLYAGSPTTNWRLLHDGTNEFNIIAISVSARTIQVNLDSKTAAGSAIEIYRNRVYGSTTSARHFSEAGLGFYQAGGDKISGLRRMDQMQQITGKFHGGMWRPETGFTGEGAFSAESEFGNSSYYGRSATKYSFNSANSPDARTGAKTEIEAGTLLAYIYVGDYTE